MKKNRSKLAAILQCKCPRCREGDIFEHSLFSFRFSKTHDYCPNCGLRYEREPGFFWSAMYFSYAFSVAHIISVLVGINILTEERPELVWYIGIILGSFVIFVPVYFRYSRVLVLHLISGVKYQPDPSLRDNEKE